ncbi:DinB family protein [Nocardioides sp.]|uniref:DinB family protein n=1 Tax=Nocardioides sp. TaxID=35761 RepID=UPI0027186788|nr:DinB family protein [Nocardioides sp.]MDO9455975.1 DinB family protein [Nocardioides sp.]
MDEVAAKARLHQDLRQARAAVLDRLKGLSDYDVRRPLTPTGTNFLGLVKHLATWESRYLGNVMGRPCPEPIPAWDDRSARGNDMWATELESRSHVLALFERVTAHSDATINELPLDAPGHVPWWHADVTLLDVVAHLIGETRQHAGHADVLRELLDGEIGSGRHTSTVEDDELFWKQRWAEVDRVARTVASDTN